MVETNDKKEVVSKRQFPGQNFRTVRRSRDGHFFIGNGSNMVEFSADGKEVWRADVEAQAAYMALKLPSGERVVASGHGGKIFTYDAKTGLKTKTVSLPDIDGTHTMTAFASAFAIIPNGSYVTTNWSGSTKIIATPALNFIKKLYAIEAKIKGRPPAEILKIRQEMSVPILDSFLNWLTDMETIVLPSSSTGKAIYLHLIFKELPRSDTLEKL